MLLVLTASAVGCTLTGTSSLEGGGTPSPSVSHIDPRDRLLELGEAWFRTPATVSYRTSGPVPGQPTTAHLCLRQMFDDDFGEDRTALLRTCSRQGTLRLVWDPPHGWQMDVITPIERFRLMSSPDGNLLCETALDPDPPCRTIPSRRVLTASPFGFLLLSPGEILEEIGAPLDAVAASPATDVLGEQVECFHASGPRGHVEWCYSPDGLLLSYLRGSATDGWTSIDATSVARGVSTTP